VTVVDQGGGTSGGYLGLLRRNPRVRRVWLAQVVSELGDWLNLVALLQVLARHAPGAQAAGWLLIIQTSPQVVLSPLSGWLVDRFDRRSVMIAADLCRAVVVLGYLLVDAPSRIPLLYALAAVHFSFTSFFEPARSALIPRLCSGPDLVRANALTGVTWSAMLSLGAALGGLLTALVNPRLAFMIDSSTFVVSALVLLGLRRAALDPEAEEKPAGEGAGQGPEPARPARWRDALAHLGRHPRVMAVLGVKTGLCLTAGALWLLSVIFGQRVFPLGPGGSLSVGLLYAAHGLGAILGATLCERLISRGRLPPQRLILAAFAVRAVFFGLLSQVGHLGLAMAALAGISACGSILWVASTTLLQTMTPDRVRGRIFAIDFAGLTLSFSLAIALSGRASDVWRWSAHRISAGAALAGAAVALVWALVSWRWGHQGPGQVLDANGSKIAGQEVP
jgi:MFS family permease